MESNSGVQPLSVILLKVGIQVAVGMVFLKYMLDYLDPTTRERKAALAKAQKLMAELGIKITEQLSSHETMIASQLVLPHDLDTGWKDIGGCLDIIKNLKHSVIKPIQLAAQTKNPLLKPPKGVLLHGPPGCGKTMIARAVARESGCNFINLDISSLTDKWYGESPKITKAVFSFARKIQPCIIFIDEIDAFLRVRNIADHDATALIKTQFLCKWDGLTTEQDAVVIVMGATNRPRDIDPAIMRRLASRFYVSLPDESERRAILKLMLREQTLDADVDIAYLASMTKQYSGADIAELCRTAALVGLSAQTDVWCDAQETVEPYQQAPLTMDQFCLALHQMQVSKEEVTAFN